MTFWQDEEFDIEIDPRAPIYVIGVVSHLLEIPVWTLRRLDEQGVVKPGRIGKNTRCYSLLQIRKLNYVKHLMEKKGVNISGIKIILNIHEERDDGGQKKSG